MKNQYIIKSIEGNSITLIEKGNSHNIFTVSIYSINTGVRELLKYNKPVLNFNSIMLLSLLV